MSAPTPTVVVPARYRHDWALFTDWCTATDRTALPASTSTLAEFLHEHPAAPATQRCRVTAVNNVHESRGLSRPGRSETVRRHLDHVRATRLDYLAARLRQRATALPATGWPAGLFGRRDALILILAATGMPYTEIAALRRGDITTDPNGGLVATAAGGERFPLGSSAGDEAGAAAALAYTRWTEILAFLDRYPNTRMLADHLTDPHQNIPIRELPERHTGQPLLVPITRWGHLPLPLQPMTPQSIAALVAAHLTGAPPVHRPLPLPADPYVTDDHVEPPAPPMPVFDPGYYERGAAARRHAHDNLADVFDILDDVEDRADQIMQNLLTLLDDV